MNNKKCCIVCRSADVDGTAMCDRCWDSFHKQEAPKPPFIPELIEWAARRAVAAERRWQTRKKTRERGW